MTETLVPVARLEATEKKCESLNKKIRRKFRNLSPPLLAMKYKDKREIRLLSTVHEGKMANTGKEHWLSKEPILKPDIVIDYNLNMRLVDKSDMQVGTIDSLRKSMKWYKKLFLSLHGFVCTK